MGPRGASSGAFHQHCAVLDVYLNGKGAVRLEQVSFVSNPSKLVYWLKVFPTSVGRPCSAVRGRDERGGSVVVVMTQQCVAPRNQARVVIGWEELGAPIMPSLRCWALDSGVILTVVMVLRLQGLVAG